ncbi:sarcosine dehydrogenase, mitochondrial isoform X2 [Belonocnema kinseyi]|uniref:sarcosine dehydrogenase, mitochondrial isoform X2 n=1 Tax=Belonocnema kinseyi TaxID=2817044 RepID=UPI00143D8801|nr:sarcosine dehydrogenase, mitochondrial isoform X2 [Belonocnema kinseyi]
MHRFSKLKFSKWSGQLAKRPFFNQTKTTEAVNFTPSVDLPESADVVIIGGGSAGCNALYHLAKTGKNIVLLDKSKLTSGTTWHTAGMVWSLRPSDVEVELLQVSKNIYQSLEEETGLAPGWMKIGGIFIAYDNVIEDCPVTKIITEKSELGSKKVTGVVTPHGTIKTNCILNACGSWSKNIAKMIGLNIPLVSMKHAYIVTEPMKNIKGLPNIRDHDGKIYIKLQGETMSIGGYELNPIILQSAPKDFSFSLYELDWNVFNSHLEAMTKLIPKLATTGIRSTVCGPESFTPDHKPIMGEDPRCDGFFYSCGYNSAGMMFGAGCGEQISNWIINGRPEKYMFKYDVRRFTPEQSKDAIWANERSHEAYAKNYSIVFPHDQPLSGRNFKTGPFHDLLMKEGAFMEESQGWEKPALFLENETVTIEPYDYCGSYGSSKNEDNKYASVLEGDYSFGFSKYHNIIKEEALACKNKAALFDLSNFGKFYLSGPEVQKAADYLFVTDTNFEINRTVETCLLNDRGGVEAICTVTAISPGSSGVVDPIFQGKAFYIVTGGLSAYQTWAHIQHEITKQGFCVSLHSATEQIGILGIEGPESRKILQKVVDADLSEKELPFLHSKLLKVNGKLSRVFRFTEVGELGYQLHIPVESCESVYNSLRKAGVSKLKLVGFRALYSLRSEKGFPLWGYDLRSDDNPIEAGLDFMCRKDKKYLGSEAVKELGEKGVKKRIAHFYLHDQIPVWGLETVYRNGVVVGYLRRGDYDFNLGKSFGQGYVRHPEGENVTKEFLELGDYQIEIMGTKYPAEIYLKSPFNHDD